MDNFYKLPLLLDPQPEGGWTITCPVLPGLVTEADTIDEVSVNVADAIEALIECYERIKPTAAGRVAPDCEYDPIFGGNSHSSRSRMKYQENRMSVIEQMCWVSSSRTLILFFVILAFGYSVLAQTKNAQNAWESKPIDQWDAADIKNILEKSVWGRVIEGENVISNPVFGVQMPRINTDIWFTLRSALTIRLAIIRKRQLAEKYDSMSPTAKAEFNKRNSSVLDCPACEKYYIVSVVGDSTTLRNKDLINSKKALIYLSNEKGDRRELANFSPQATSGSEAAFYFLRNNEKGEPLLSPDNKTLTFRFNLNVDEELRLRFLQKVDIKVADLVRDGKVIF